MATVIDGSASVTINSGAVLGITSGTAVASTSGTSIDFTGYSFASTFANVSTRFNFSFIVIPRHVVSNDSSNFFTCHLYLPCPL